MGRPRKDPKTLVKDVCTCWQMGISYYIYISAVCDIVTLIMRKCMIAICWTWSKLHHNDHPKKKCITCVFTPTSLSPHSCTHTCTCTSLHTAKESLCVMCLWWKSNKETIRVFPLTSHHASIALKIMVNPVYHGLWSHKGTAPGS